MLWPILKEKAVKEGLPINTVVVEVLHLASLDALFALPESEAMSLQGGTGIHLLYGGYRYSEDLDFAGKELDRSLAERLVARSKSRIEKITIQLLGQGRGDWRIPPDTTKGKICAFWFRFQPKGQQQIFRVKMEFAHYPTYESQALAVRSDLDLLGRHPLINGLSAKELLAEKVAAVAGRPYIKGRDLFDLWYLSEVLDTPVELPLVEKKFRDYQVVGSHSRWKRKLTAYGTEPLTAEMQRYLPKKYRRLLKGKGYDAIRQAAMRVMIQAINALSSQEEG